MQLNMDNCSRQQGATMIEVLVSIVLASFALLALAGVNASSVRYTKMSQYRATASQLANDMGERIRANKGASTAPTTGFFAGNYDYTDDFAAQAATPTLPGELCNLGASNCTPAQIAALDLAQWRILVRNQLPEGSVFLARQNAQVAMDLWIAWRDPSVANADEAPASAGECPAGLNLGADTSVRCSYFRINL
jgi:type IV pilus assembly protein PilV